MTPAQLSLLSTGLLVQVPPHLSEIQNFNKYKLKFQKIGLIVPLNFETKGKGVSNLKEMVGILPHAFDYRLLGGNFIHRS